MDEYGDFRSRRQQTVWHSLNRFVIVLIAMTVVTLIACAFVPQLKAAREQADRIDDLRGQIGADVRDSILDIQAAAKQVAVSRSNVELAAEALSEAQQRYAAGVADNLAVSQAQASAAQADARPPSDRPKPSMAAPMAAGRAALDRTSFIKASLTCGGLV